MSAQRPKSAEGFELEPLSFGVRLIGPDGASHALNPAAALVLLLCDGVHTDAEMAGFLAKQLDLEVEPLECVDEALADLARIGAVH